MATKPKKAHRSHPARVGRPDDGEAFVPDVGMLHIALADDDAESFGEEFIVSATSGEFVGEDARDEVIAEELDDAKRFTFMTEEEPAT